MYLLMRSHWQALPVWRFFLHVTLHVFIAKYSIPCAFHFLNQLSSFCSAVAVVGIRKVVWVLGRAAVIGTWQQDEWVLYPSTPILICWISWIGNIKIRGGDLTLNCQFLVLPRHSNQQSHHHLINKRFSTSLFVPSKIRKNVISEQSALLFKFSFNKIVSFPLLCLRQVKVLMQFGGGLECRGTCHFWNKKLNVCIRFSLSHC